METALVGVATGVMKPLLSKLCTLLQEKRAKRKSLQRDTEFLRDEMSTMSATLQILGDSEQLNAEMTIWRDNVRELSYDMEDCVDDFIAHGAYKRDGPTGLIQKIREKWKKWKPRNKAVSEIEELKTRLIEASKRHKRYATTPPTPDPNTSAQDPLPLLQARFPVDELIGIDDPKQHIMEQLTKFQLQVVSIVGSGGLGKTTLASQVYSEIKGDFSCAAFVSVSRKPNIKAVLRGLAESVGITHLSDDVVRLTETLREYLKDKRYFIVIDDVWEVEAWETIRRALFKNDCGSRIITTTRNQKVASSSCIGGYVYQMRPLSSTDSKTLLFERAFGVKKQDHPHLQEASSEILKKCGGLPLAIIAIAGMLYNRDDLDEWNRVLASIGSALAKETGAVNMTKILSLSYVDLPHHLRACLLYLSLFPEDGIIYKDHLIFKWIAEGFIDENQGQSAYEVGEGYFNDLLNRSLIQSDDPDYRQAACRVHDIVLDFITCKAAEENFATSLDVEENFATPIDAEMNRGVSAHRVRRLSIHNRSYYSEAALPTSLMLSHLRSLTVFGRFGTTDLSAFPYIRVLDMRRGGHFENIGILVFLKYLAFPEDIITELPARIEDLQHLETLDIRSTQIRKLPSTITRLQRLAHLRVPGHTVFPAGTIGKMKSLEELDCFTVSSGEQVQSLEEFSQLTKLRKLMVICLIDWSNDSDERRRQAGNLQSHVGTLISACNLHHLEVYRGGIGQERGLVLSMESWVPATPCRLRKLSFTYCYIDKVPNWMSSCANLRELQLFVLSIGPEDLLVLGAIPTLLGLTLSTTNGQEGMILIPGGYGFRILNYFCLTIVQCRTSLLFELGSMPKLEHLKLGICGHKIECFNGGSDFGINHLSALTKVELVISGHANNLQAKDTVKRLVKAAMETLPKHPILLVKLGFIRNCVLNGSEENKNYKRRNDNLNVEPKRQQAASAGEIEQEAPRVLDEADE